MSRILLTASLIVKNEEKFLDSCLASLEGVVDEIVVVDTGSTDRTKEIALQRGARVSDFAWTGDFSLARNRALELSQGEWILYIDADERVRPESAAGLRTALLDPVYAGYEVLLHPLRGHTPYWILRFFRNHPTIRFRGIIHENIWPALNEYCAKWGGKVGKSQVILDHEGYEGDQAAKNARNLPLLLKGVEQDPSRVYSWCHLANIYTAMKEDQLAENAWLNAIKVVRKMGPRAPEDILPYLGLIQKGSNRGEDISGLLGEAMTLFKSSVQLQWLRGHILIRERQYREAAAIFEKLVALGNSGDYDRGAAYDQRLFSVFAYECIALCHFRLGEYAESRRYYDLAAQREPDRLDFRVKRALCEKLERKAGPVAAEARP